MVHHINKTKHKRLPSYLDQDKTPQKEMKLKDIIICLIKLNKIKMKRKLGD